MGKVIMVIGGQWGDEAKGKCVDFLADKSDIIARATGGNNAGHTVIVGNEKFKFHLLPSGVIHKGKLNICGNGMAIYPGQLVKEISSLEERGFRLTEKSLLISNAAHVITEEQLEKDKKTGERVGTTGRGIGPCYTAKAERTGTRISEFVRQNNAEAKRLKQFAGDSYKALSKAIEEKKNILIEGAQGTMLDIDHGTYPYVTSSSPTAGGQCAGLGIGPTKISEVIAVIKAYTTRVGRGPFPTELGRDEQTRKEKTLDEIEPDFEKEVMEALEKGNKGDEYSQGRYLRLIGREYGTTTGRARRTGWFDGVIARYSYRINGVTSFALTKLDCLSGLDRIKLCTAYEIGGKEIGGRKTEDFPTDQEELQKAKPVYEEMEGWKCDISGADRFEKLPPNCRRYIKRIEELSGAPICIVSVGPKRSQTIVLKKEMLF